jgi:hypothetical protein
MKNSFRPQVEDLEERTLLSAAMGLPTSPPATGLVHHMVIMDATLQPAFVYQKISWSWSDASAAPEASKHTLDSAILNQPPTTDIRLRRVVQDVRLRRVVGDVLSDPSATAAMKSTLPATVAVWSDFQFGVGKP